MKLLLIVSASIALTSALGCSVTTTSPVASSRDAYLGEREQVMQQTAIECGAGNGQCTAHFYATPTQRPEAKVEPQFYPLELRKPEHLSSR